MVLASFIIDVLIPVTAVVLFVGSLLLFVLLLVQAVRDDRSSGSLTDEDE